MKCKPLSLGLDVSGLEVLYPNQSRTNDPSIISHYVSLGYNLFRILFRWERLQPSLINNLQSGLPSTSVTFDSTYLNLILSYVEECQNLGVNCILVLDNSGWYDVSYNSSYVNDGTEACPSSNYVYLGQGQTTINNTTYIGPSIAQYSNMWITLAESQINSTSISNSSYVRFGLGQRPTLYDDVWIPYMNQLIANLRSANINNILYVDTQGSSIDTISDFSNIDDSLNKTICNVNYYDDGNNGNGTAVLTTTDYLNAAVLLASISRNSSSPFKISFGDVRFDSGSTAITALNNFIGYVKNNIDVFESVCLYAIGDSNNIPTSYNLNYTTSSSGTITYPTQITTAPSSPIVTQINNEASILSGSTVSYIYDSPFGSTYQSLETGELSLPVVTSNSNTSLTIEFFLKRLSGDTSVGYVFGNSKGISVWFDSSYVYARIGNESYLQVKIDNLYLDSAWHHYEIGFDPSNILFFIDGKIVGKSILSTTKNLDGDLTLPNGVRDNGGVYTSTPINGYISNLVIWSELKDKSNFDVPTSYYSGTENNILLNLTLNGVITSNISQ